MITKVFSLLDKIIDTDVNSSKQLNDLYNEMNAVLKKLSKGDLTYIDESVSASRNNSLIMYSRGYAGMHEDYKKIKIYDKVLSLVHSSMLEKSTDREF